AEQMAYWGFDSCAAESGMEGLKVLDAAAALGIKVDCVVADYQMPGMTGVDTARAIRASAAFGDTPIVLLSSIDQSLSSAGMHDLAVDAQLIKPARSASLLETLVHTIQKHRGKVLEAEGGRAEAAASIPEHAAGGRQRVAGRAATPE